MKRVSILAPYIRPLLDYPLLLATTLLVMAGAGASGETVSYPQLVRQMTDLSLLARKPAKGETMWLASSYDRRSTYDAATDRYVDWDADADGGGFARMEGQETVMADIHGSGCISRIWAATAAAGHVKIYLNGSDTPAVDLPFLSYFDGTSEPFNRPALDYRMSSGNTGFDNYTPIPFQEGCKIVADPGWGLYYQISYRKFAPGTVVPTFSLPLSPEDSAALDRANAILSAPGDPATARQPGQATQNVDVDIPAGKSAVVFDRKGDGAITAFRVKFALPSGVAAQRTFLRQLALRMIWDGQGQPSVWAPWGDFFGDPAGATPYQSLPMGLGSDGYWYCHWYMPYAKRATIAIDNDSPTPIQMSWEITHAPLTVPAGSLLRFHAKWHRDAFLPARKDRDLDWTLLTTTGQGRYVGTQLDVSNPRGGWWGEGDDKFFVDGEKFPSDFGTGSEDYFGAGWGFGSAFGKAFHGLTTTAPFNRGFIGVYRWHIADNFPFQSSFEGDIEKYYNNDSPCYTRDSAVAYWYLDASGADPYPSVPVSRRTGYWADPPIYNEPGAIEGEQMPILLQQPAGTAYPFDAILLSIAPQIISNDRVLRWTAVQIGQQLELGFKAPAAGRYRIVGRFLRRDSCGIFQFAVNGQNLGQPVDLYGPPQGDQAQATEFYGGSLSYATVIDPISLGECTLQSGDNTFSATVVGDNPRQDMYANQKDLYLDYIKLVPIP